ncbi:MAG: SRPBCC domain-containing protein [Xanthobacteraceae bacterium]
MDAAAQAKPLAERELTIVRVFDAPRALVFRAWTDSRHLAQWWGPKGFTNPVCEIDARVGGAIRIHMRAPDGAVYPMGGEFREIVELERLVFTNNALDDAGNAIIEGLTTATFADEGGKTRLTLHTRGHAMVEKAVQYLQGMEMGWTMSIDKLQVFLAGFPAVAGGNASVLAEDDEPAPLGAPRN